MKATPTRLRQKKLSPEKIRALLIEAGIQILTAPEFRGIMTTLTLKAAFEKIQLEHGILLTNASVIGRSFDSVAHFRRTVLLAIAAGDSEDFAVNTANSGLKVFLEADLSTPEMRWTALEQRCRVMGNFIQETLQKSPTWRLWLGILAYAIQEPEINHDLIDALRSSYLRLDQQSLEIHTFALAFLGFREIQAGGLNQMSNHLDFLIEGVGIRGLVEPESTKAKFLPTGRDGKREKWTKLSLGLWTVVQHSVELDPDWVAP